MRIALWALRIVALLIAVMVSIALRPDFGRYAGEPAVLALLVTLMAYAWGLALALLWVRLEARPPRRAWLALAPLGCQLALYVAFWATGVTPLEPDLPAGVVSVLQILAVISFLLGFPAALPAGLVFRRARALILVEALGPPILLLVLGVGAALP